MNDSMAASPAGSEKPSPVGRGRRLLATLIDLALLGVVSLVVVLVTGVFEEVDAYLSRSHFFLRFYLVLLTCYLAINGAWLFTRGQTLGKHWLGIRVVARGSELPPGRLRLLLRAFALPLLAVMPFGVFLLLLDPLPIFGSSRRCLHDYLVNTEVTWA
jgi:uncharacterized RDD family membrane protein YckC